LIKVHDAKKLTEHTELTLSCDSVPITTTSHLTGYVVDAVNLNTAGMSMTNKSITHTTVVWLYGFCPGQPG